MARRRFVFDRERFELVEVSPDYIQPAKNADHVLWNDREYDGLKATDGTDISSRTKHREYMRQNNLTTIDDYTEHFKKCAEKRAAYFQGQPGTGAISKQDIARAIHELENKRG